MIYHFFDTDPLFSSNLNAMALAALATGTSLQQQQPPSLTPPPSIPSISSISASSPLSVASGLSAAQLSVASGLSAAQQLSAASQLNFSVAQQLSVAQSLQQHTAQTSPHPFAFLAAANGQMGFNGGALPLCTTAGGQVNANGAVGVGVPMALNGMGFPVPVGLSAMAPMGVGVPMGIPAMSNLNLLQLIAANAAAVQGLPGAQGQAYAALLQQAFANQQAAAMYPGPRCLMSTNSAPIIK